MRLFSKEPSNKNTNESLYSMMNDLRIQQQCMVEKLNKLNKDQCESQKRLSDVISDVETCMAKLDQILHRLVQQGDESLKPWYVRIFCP